MARNWPLHPERDEAYPTVITKISPKGLLMSAQTFIRFSAPLIVLSTGLACLGTAAAWNVHRQQVQTSEIIDREVHSLVAIQNLYVVMREVRHLLVAYLRTSDLRQLDEIDSLDPKAANWLEQARGLAGTEQEHELIEGVASGYQRFRADLNRSRQTDAEGRQKILDVWADHELKDAVLDPASAGVRLNEAVVERANTASRQTSRHLTQGFLWLGLTGATAGAMTGVAMTRSLRKSLWELHVSVTGAAGRLDEVIGPFPETSHGGFSELQRNLQELERRITRVVKQLQQREHEVLRNEQLAALGQLAAGLAHELRNPLMPMKLLVQAALERGESGGLQGRNLHVIRDEIARMERSIQTFLDFARPPALERSSTDLNCVVKETIELVSSRAKIQGTEILQPQTAGPCVLNVDAAQIKQVLLNLLLNSMDSLGHDGRITVTLQADAPEPVSEEPPPRPARRGGLMTVLDNGPGIPDELMPVIFEPFRSAKDTGTGLGLTICRRIVDAHDGRITAVQPPDGGACFRVWLPAEPPHESDERSPSGD
jgi:signal transduction histidine kinase